MTTRRPRPLACLALALAGVGCGADDSFGPAGMISEEIIGGSVDTGDPAVMLLFAQKGSSNQGYLCSATLIAPTVLVTAAHCVAPASVGNNVSFQAFSGTDWAKATSSSWAAIKEVHYDTAFDPRNLAGGHDIAVAILAKAATARPVQRNHSALPDSVTGQAARIVGFGVSDGNTLGGVGIKRVASAKVDDTSSRFLHIGDAAHQSCEGDSGGPAFLTLGGVETLVGVTSYGQVGCVGGGWHTRVDAYNAFLDKYAAPSTAPAPAVAATTARRTLSHTN